MRKSWVHIHALFIPRYNSRGCRYIKYLHNSEKHFLNNKFCLRDNSGSGLPIKKIFNEEDGLIILLNSVEDEAGDYFDKSSDYSPAAGYIGEF